MSRRTRKRGWCTYGFIVPTLVVLIILGCATPAHPQGCSQCRETIGQAPARTQLAFRHAITAMMVAASSVFLASIFVFKRFR